VTPPGKAVGDRFTSIPPLVAAVVWLLTIVPLVYDIGGPLDPSMFPALAIFPAALIGCVVFLSVCLFRWRWRLAVSTMAAGVVFLGAATLTLKFSHEVRFQTMRPIYLFELAFQPDSLKTRSWAWSGGIGYQESITYDEADLDAPPRGKTSVVGHVEGCTVRTLPMGGHFYFHRLSCDDSQADFEAGYAFGSKLQEPSSRFKDP